MAAKLKTMNKIIRSLCRKELRDMADHLRGQSN